MKKNLRKQLFMIITVMFFGQMENKSKLDMFGKMLLSLKILSKI